MFLNIVKSKWYGKYFSGSGITFVIFMAVWKAMLFGIMLPLIVGLPFGNGMPEVKVACLAIWPACWSNIDKLVLNSDEKKWETCKWKLRGSKVYRREDDINPHKVSLVGEFIQQIRVGLALLYPLSKPAIFESLLVFTADANRSF